MLVNGNHRGHTAGVATANCALRATPSYGRKRICARLLLPAVVVLCAGCAIHPPPASTEPASSAQAGETTIVAIAPPAQSPPTLPQLLGLNDLFGGVGKLVHHVINTLGSRFPGLEPGPPVSAIADPANADSPVPAVAAAAKVKAEEDAAPQKIKALRYLATIGCGGCYPDVEDAILAGLDDCTEEVRYEAARALRTAAGDPCKFCRSTSCCSAKVVEKLDKIANEMDGRGCYKEPSDRVRRLARLSLAACSGASAESVEELPSEGPTLEPPPEAPTEGPRSASTPNEGVRPATFVANQHDIGPQRQSPRNIEVRWERVTAASNRFPSGGTAHRTIQMIRARALGSTTLVPDQHAVALLETESYDWTSLESLWSEPLQRALASTTVGEISDVFEDSYGVHVVRVLARRPAQNRGR